MDWQHLLMNGEHLPEYAALLRVRRAARPPARQLRLGHVRRRQHGRHDGVHGDARAGARAPALRLRRRRRAARLRSLPVHRGPGRGRAGARSCSGASSTRSRPGSTTPRCARPSSARTRCAPTSSSTPRSVREPAAPSGSTSERPRSRRSRSIRPARCWREPRPRYPFATPRPGWVEQDPEDWWRATETVLEALRSDAGPPAGIGLSGQMHGLVALDSADRVLRPAILWNDQRTAAQCREIEDALGLERLIELTGNRALPGFTAPKLLWLRETEPDVWSRVASVMLPKDYVRLRLCGARATDVSDASGTLLLDVAGAALEPRRARRARARRRAGCRRCSRARRSRARRAAGVPVAAGAGDQAAGALGVGVDRARAAVGRARDLGRRVRRQRAVRRRPARSPARVLPREPVGLARDGRDAVRRRIARLGP